MLKAISRSTAVASFLVSAACSADLVNVPTNAEMSDPSGVPWVEPVLYDVYVYVIKPPKDGVGATPQLLHYNQHALSDKVNGMQIDSRRKRWMTNYSAEPFSNAVFSLGLDENGAPKTISLTGTPQLAQAIEAATALATVEDELEKKELERLKREKELRDARAALEADAD